MFFAMHTMPTRLDGIHTTEEYQNGSKKIFFDRLKEAEKNHSVAVAELMADIEEAAELMSKLNSQIQDKDNKLNAHATEMENLEASKQEEIEDLMKQIDTLQTKVKDLTENHAKELQKLLAGKPQIIPILGRDHLSFQSDLTLRWGRLRNFWNDLSSQSKNAYENYAPKVISFYKDSKEAVQAALRRMENKPEEAAETSDN